MHTAPVHSDAKPQISRIEISKDADADWYAEDRPNREWPSLLQIEAVTQLEDAIALRE